MPRVPASATWVSRRESPGHTLAPPRGVFTDLGSFWALPVFDPVTFSVGRSNARDCKGLLENDLAGELSQHRHGHKPRGSGQGKPLLQLPGWRMLALPSRACPCFAHCAKCLLSNISPSRPPMKEKSSLPFDTQGMSFPFKPSSFLSPPSPSVDDIISCSSGNLKPPDMNSVIVTPRSCHPACFYNHLLILSLYYQVEP